MSKKANKKEFDLGSLRTTHEEGSVLELVDLYGKPILNSDGDKITITLLSADSPIYKAAVREQQNTLLNKKGRRGTSQLDMEVIEGISRKARAKITLAWSKGFILDGKTLECTFENALLLYENIAEIDDQVSEFIADRINFTKAS